MSLDFELIWGTQDLYGNDGFGEQCRIEREIVIDGLLELFREFDISATWCIVGHLFLDECSSVSGIKHSEIVRPAHSWVDGDWFEIDPCSSLKEAPNFYGRDLVEKIRDFPVRQEIGSHSFSHIIYGDEGCSVEAADSDLMACTKAASELDINMSSFVFPRNEVGHLDLVKDYGFSAYRGVEPNWFETHSVPQSAKRMFRLWDVLTAATPPTSLPMRTQNGIWNIPGSAMYFPMDGIRRFIPMERRVRRAIKGLNRAVEKNEIFHFWFHPTNLATSTDQLFNGLRKILEHVNKLREQNKLDVLTMNKIVACVENLGDAVNGHQVRTG